MRFRFVAWVGLALMVASCGGSSTSPTTTTRIPAPPATTESFIGTLGVGSSRFYSFSVSQYGTVNVGLNSVDDADGPSTVALGLGIGTPSGTGCSTTTTVTTSSGSTTLATGIYEAGVYCVRIFDVGNLVASATFNVGIAYP